MCTNPAYVFVEVEGRTPIVGGTLIGTLTCFSIIIIICCFLLLLFVCGCGMKFDREFASKFVTEEVAQHQSVDQALVKLKDVLRSAVPPGPGYSRAAASSSGELVVPDVFNMRDGVSSAAEAAGQLVRCRGMIQDVQTDLTVLRTVSGDVFAATAAAAEKIGESAKDSYVETAVLRVIPVPGNVCFYDGDERRGERMGAASHTLQGAGSPTAEEADFSLAVAMNFPFPSAHPNLLASCIVTVPMPKVDGAPQLPFRINDVYDFYGYLMCETPGISGKKTFYLYQEPEDPDIGEVWGGHWEPGAEGSRVTRLMAALSVPLSTASTYTGPSTHPDSGGAEPESPDKSTWFEQRRAFAVHYLAGRLCSGNELAAEYLLLHLCSHVLAHSSATPLGDVPLLMRTPSAPQAAAWAAVLRDVVPMAAVYMDETSDFLRAGAEVGQKRCGSDYVSVPQPLAPRFDTATNCLQAGALQLANGTNLVVDCQQLASSLEDNRSPLHDIFFSVIHESRLPIDYPYHRVDVPIRVSVLALAPVGERVPDLLRFPVEVACGEAPSRGERAAYPAQEHCSTADIRDYIAAVRRQGMINYAHRQEHLTPDLQALIARGLVRLGDELEGWNNHHSLLHNNTFSVVTSLIGVEAASRGRSAITKTDIEHIFSSERERVAALPVSTSSRVDSNEKCLHWSPLFHGASLR
eukprot:gene9152-6433_t